MAEIDNHSTTMLSKWVDMVISTGDGFETGKITGIVLIDLSAAYDTVKITKTSEKGNSNYHIEQI